MRRGLDLTVHANSTNIDLPIKELIIHLKQKSRFKIFYEKLDPNLLLFINQIQNGEIKHYHRDNFLVFKDLSDTFNSSSTSL